MFCVKVMQVQLLVDNKSISIKMRGATIRFIVSVLMEQLDSHWVDFHELL